VRRSLIALVKRLVVDLDGTGTCASHDLFRDAIIASVTRESARALGRLLDLRRAYAELEVLEMTGVEPRLVPEPRDGPGRVAHP
jgi:hypothetical protein